MKKLILPVFAILLSVILAASIPTAKEAALYEDTVRLHILANSDSEEDQKLKLELRDEILKEYSQCLKKSENTEEAKETVEELLPSIKDFAESELRERGYDYSVRATLSEEWYDTREYDSFTLPSGYYSSLKIEIGDAVGKNWWCVMFPPLCLDIALENAPADDGILNYTKEEVYLISAKKYNVKFKILELLSETFS